MHKPSDNLPFFSIITVVFNAEQHIEYTIQSVIEQNHANYEYIVIDGGSLDQTLAIIDKYRDKIDLLVSEADRGIYDAMNKGIQLAKGEYINFINAGDAFYDKHTLQEIYLATAKADNQRKIDIVHGKVVNVSAEEPKYGYEVGKPVSKCSLFLSMPMCHQTMFTRRDVFD